MTANALTGMEEYFLSSGMNDFLPKPIDINRLNSILSRWLDPDKLDKHGPETASKRACPRRQGYYFPRLRGIDSAVGLSRSGDNLEVYLKIMKSFLKDSRDMPAAVRGAFHREDSKALIALAHALRGSCGAIGAVSLADQSLAIEAAVSSGDTSFVATHIENLIKDLSEAIEDLSAFVGQNESEAFREGGDMASQEEVAKDLRNLRKAFQETDAVGVETAIKRLRARSIPKWLRQTLEECWGHFQDVEFDEAIERIDRLLEGDWPAASSMISPYSSQRRPH
jgi:HPt (histidine-containing phosphotransfer) domain-containing protein